MSQLSYEQRRSQIETYFDRTASDAWAKLTSDAPVGRIRATVRAGRDEMRATLLSWLPDDLLGFRLLDAGCGTGVLSVAAAQRGASVVAVDLSPTLVDLARERLPSSLGLGEIDFRSGDMLSSALGEFDYVVGMDSLIHYNAPDAVKAVAALAQRTRCGLLFTFAPSNPLLAAMHALGKLFPRGDRSPAIEPVSPARLTRLIDAQPLLDGWRQGRTRRVKSGFYTSQALELLRA
jgi:magnesium-protoporphyrin O-methyltransferase